jgi:hypothetical protein
MTPGRAILAGGLVVGILDGLDAIIFFGLRGVKPGRIFQGIASGLLGRAAFSGGPATVLLGILLHFTVATGIVAVCVLVSRRLTVIARQPIAAGMAYGVIAWLVMNYVVIPLSLVTPGPRPPAVVANGLLIHMFGVGLPAALVARRVHAA